MSGGANRSRYAWAFLTRHFTRRLESNAPRGGDSRPSIEATVIFVDPRSRGLRGLSVGRSTEMVPTVNYESNRPNATGTGDSEEISISSVSEGVDTLDASPHIQNPSRGPTQPTSQRQQTIDILSGRARRVGSEIVDLLPFWGGEEEPAFGDDPTFQQLLCLAGVFCGPLMYLIGGILFCVIPREHKQTRRWALFNLVLAVCSFVYLASTGSIEEMQRPVAGIHMLDGADHVPVLDLQLAQKGGLREARLNFTGHRQFMNFATEDWHHDWASDSDSFTRLKLDLKVEVDSGSALNDLWVFGPIHPDQNGTLSCKVPIEMTQHVYIRSSLASDRPLKAPLQTSPVRYLDCTNIVSDGLCKGVSESVSTAQDAAVSAKLQCQTSEGVANSRVMTIELWSREVDATLSPSGSIRPFVEDTLMNFGEQRLWCLPSYMLCSAPANVYIKSQSVFT
eukprot:Gregarina_sp_Poly_1__1401@NODE_1349_length_4315_cov_87_969868_g905_i0_p1_GENE_NODE_1349_length_4315_cov_87_969868_g905_i0NODE_1349_length_4315_cov_87_969868_g905_i0_p1_ORF_typecomplete_len450_score31_18Aa_trans/PF01490_18/0_19_NODE_1349_length_4315_cov_87_969868_g905_i017013050